MYKRQNLPYAEQLRFKTEQVRDQLARIGKVELPEIAPCLPSAETRFYMRFSNENRKANAVFRRKSKSCKGFALCSQ